MVDSEAPTSRPDIDRRAGRAAIHLVLLNVLIVLVSPVILFGKILAFVRRRPSRHYDPARWFGYGSAGKRDAPVDGLIRVMYLAPSFGEVLIGASVHARLAELCPAVSAMWTIRSRKELEYIQERRPDLSATLWPFDFIIPTRRWLRDYRPDVVVFVEKFWFGNLVLASVAKGVRVVALNARANPRRGTFLRCLSIHYPWIVEACDTLCFQTAGFRSLLDPMIRNGVRAVVTGNIKMDMPARAISPDRLYSLKQWVTADPDRLVLVAGSTDSLEEDRFVTEAFLSVRKSVACTLVVAPRRLERCDEILAYWQSLGLAVSRRTDPREGADVLLLDTLGELAHLFAFSCGAFIGGTIIGAGHNIMEPLRVGVPVAYGPCRDHFEELQHRCEDAGVGFRVESPEQLADHWGQVLQSSEFRDATRARIEAMLAADRGAFESTVQALAAVVQSVQAERSLVTGPRSRSSGDAAETAAAPPG